MAVDDSDAMQIATLPPPLLLVVRVMLTVTRQLPVGFKGLVLFGLRVVGVEGALLSCSTSASSSAWPLAEQSHGSCGFRMYACFWLCHGG